MSVGPPLFEAVDLARRYPLDQGWRGPKRWNLAVDGVSFAIRPGISFGLVGESGSGKSTIARLAMALERPDAGTVRFEGADLFTLPPPRLRALRRRFQMVFQDPYGSLDPRQQVLDIVAEPLDVAEPKLDALTRRERVAAMLEAVGLKAADAARYPHEFSGGQRQRVALARALVTRPALIVADEPVSALDVSVQAQVLNLLLDLREGEGVTYLFISHNLAVVEHVAEEVGVLYRGRLVEEGPAQEVFARPAHPYTQALVAAVPSVNELGRAAQPTPAIDTDDSEIGAGCPFAPRCPRVEARCREAAPALRAIAPGRRAACHLV